jgi:histone H3/H4
MARKAKTVSDEDIEHALVGCGYGKFHKPGDVVYIPLKISEKANLANRIADYQSQGENGAFFFAERSVNKLIRDLATVDLRWGGMAGLKLHQSLEAFLTEILRCSKAVVEMNESSTLSPETIQLTLRIRDIVLST